MDVLLKDVAERAGISVSAVSRALNGKPGVSEETRRQVKEAADALGYTMRKQRKARRQVTHSLEVAVVTAYTKAVLENSLIYSRGLTALTDAATDMNCRLVMMGAEEAASRQPNYDAALFFLVSKPDTYWERQREVEKPFIIVGRHGVSYKDSSVVTDDERGAFQACLRLLRSGRRRIAFIGYEEDPQEPRDARFRGYLRAHELEGVTPESSLWSRPDGQPFRHADDAYIGELVQQLYKRECPEAIMAVNDRVAVKVLMALQSLGLSVPKDCAVVGYDDTHGELTSPSLSSIHNPFDLLTTLALNHLVLAVNRGVNLPVHTVVQPYYVTRESCGTGEVEL